MAKRQPLDKPTCGWREWVGLPELGIERIKAKVDTGARSSALHAWDVQVFREDGVEKVRFTVHPIQRETATTITAIAPLLEHRWVKSSVGHETLRAVILTGVTLGAMRWPIELSLVNRDAMGFRLLLGRQALRAGKLRVDPARSYLLGEKPARGRKKPPRAARGAGGEAE